jgi:hypothetical protein
MAPSMAGELEAVSERAGLLAAASNNGSSPHDID